MQNRVAHQFRFANVTLPLAVVLASVYVWWIKDKMLRNKDKRGDDGDDSFYSNSHEQERARERERRARSYDRRRAQELESLELYGDADAHKKYKFEMDDSDDDDPELAEERTKKRRNSQKQREVAPGVVVSFLDPSEEPDPETREPGKEVAADGDVLEVLYSLTLGSTGERLVRSEVSTLKLTLVGDDERRARCSSGVELELLCVRGLTSGLKGAAVGDVRKVVLRPPMGFGAAGHPPSGVGPNETLIFQLEVRDITAM